MPTGGTKGLASEYLQVNRHDIYTAQSTVRPRGIQHSLYRVLHAPSIGCARLFG